MVISSKAGQLLDCKNLQELFAKELEQSTEHNFTHLRSCHKFIETAETQEAEVFP